MAFSTILSNILIAGGPFTGLTKSKAIVSFLLLIDAKIYGLFAQLYKLYVNIARAKIFDVTAFDFLVNNIYIIFGVVALFILAFFLLQGMINPDESGAGTKSIKQFVTRFVIALFLTFLVPTMFDFLYDIQDSVLSYSVIPKVLLSESSFSNEITVPVKYEDKNGNPIYVIPVEDENGEVRYNTCDPTDEETFGCEELVYNATVDIADSSLNSGGYGIAYHVLTGFFYPNYNQDIIVNASDYFTTETGVSAGIWTCIGAGAAAALGAVITGVSVPATGGTLSPALAYFTAHAGATAAIACGLGAASAVGINALGEKITAKEYSWAYASEVIQTTGDFEQITYFEEAVIDGRMSYTPIISTIAGLILLYMIFSFCLDLGVRAAKLVLYQIMAPLSFLISVIPSKKDLMNNWFKAVIATWLEVFVKIFCVCGAALLIRELNFDAFSGMSFVAKAIIVLGIVTFAKQFPKILADLTGIKSGNFKLGIREKLAEGGAFTAGAIIGGGATAFARNLTNRWANKENWKNKNGDYTVGSILKNIGGGLASAGFGTVSGQFRAGKAGLKAKSWADMKSAAGTGAAGAVAARDKRASYKASHGGTWFGYELDENGDPHFTGTLLGHISDAVSRVSDAIGYGTSDTTLGYYTKAAQSSNSFNDLSESTYKKKPEYVDQSSRVKALESKVKAAKDAGDKNRENTYLAELAIEKAALKDMQRGMAYKKKDVISIAATQLSVDQRANYSGDKEFIDEYRKAIFAGFDISSADYGRSRIEKITLPNGEERSQRVLVAADGAETRMSFDDTSILEAMLTGGEVLDEWITEDNVVKIQEAIDKVNQGRQHIKTGKERQHIVRNANKSTDKKDK